MNTPIYIQHEDCRPLTDEEIASEEMKVRTRHQRTRNFSTTRVTDFVADRAYLKALRDGMSRQDARAHGTFSLGVSLGAVGGFLAIAVILFTIGFATSLAEVMDATYAVLIAVSWFLFAVFGTRAIVAVVRWCASKVRAKSKKPQEAGNEVSD